MPLRQNSFSLTLALLTAAHLAVDLACFYLLYNMFRPQFGDLTLVARGFLLYNVVAFGLQPLIGAALDRSRCAFVAPAGCLLVALGLLIGQRLAWPGLVTVALGNAGFHAAGGRISLKLAEGRAVRPGVFVSSGAVGVSGGIVLAAHACPLWPVLTLLLVCSALLLTCSEPESAYRPFALSLRPLPFGLLLTLFLLAVVIRALAGGLAPMAWRQGDTAIMLAGCAAAAGKALGGMAGDRWGFRFTALVSLLLSLPLLSGGGQLMWLSLLGLLLFNMAMPLTLCATYDLLPDSPGLAFGATTLALLTGTVPLFFLDLTPGAAAISVAVSGLIAVVCLALAFGPKENKHEQTSA